MFTPQEIQEKTFVKAVFGGYDMATVDEFLEPLTEDYITLYKENAVLKSKMKVLVEKLEELIGQGKDFDAISKEIAAYQEKTGLMFSLESLKNLANNGRVSTVVAKAAGLLGIRVVGQASARGDLEMLDKCRGQKRALSAIVGRMKEFGYKGGKVRIAHCSNEEAALKLKELIEAEYQDVEIECYKTRGLCSFYAEQGGMLIGYEC